MATVTTFCEFFGCSNASSEPASDDSIDYVGLLQIEHFGRDVNYVNPDGTTSTFRAIVHKERKEFKPTEYGNEEQILRDVGFPSDDTNGRASVLINAEMRIGTIRYQVGSHELRGAFWHVVLKRVNVGEISRANRRGRV